MGFEHIEEDPIELFVKMIVNDVGSLVLEVMTCSICGENEVDGKDGHCIACRRMLVD